MAPRHRSAPSGPAPDPQPTNSRLRAPVIIPVALALVAAGVTVAAATGNLKTSFDKTALQRHRPQPSASATATTAPADNADCDIVVPANPLTAAGLATPYQLTGPNGTSPATSGCSQTNATLQAFAEATIINPATGALSVYHPLVITAGTTPAATPVVPKLPTGAVVGIWFGFNGDNLTQKANQRRTIRHLHARGTGNSLTQGKCVNGLGTSVFGQVSYCNTPAFFSAANKAIAAHKLTIPALGNDKSGQACPTTRSFTVVDQDQSDNVDSTYLLDTNGRTAQSNKTNSAKLTGAQQIGNGSDDALLNAFLQPALGCQPFTAPDLSNAGAQSPSQALNELQAGAHQQAPIALVPENDPMVLVDGAYSAAKTNLYRAGVGQPAVSTTQTDDTPTQYCTNMINVQTAMLTSEHDMLAGGSSPAPDAATNLYSFLGFRLNGSYTNLGCDKLLNATNPITLTTNSNGQVTDAAFGPLTPNSASPSASASTQPTSSASATPAPSASTSQAPAPSASPSQSTTCQPTVTSTGALSANRCRRPIPPPVTDTNTP